MTIPAKDLRAERAFDAFGESIGRRRHELTTPALILDLTILRQNLETMAEWTRMHAKVRPNAKDSQVWGDRSPAGCRRSGGHHDGDRSAGGTNTYDMTGAKPRVTELQGGSYVFTDATYGPLTPAFKPALSMLGTVISRNEQTAILDCGTQVMAKDSLESRRV